MVLALSGSECVGSSFRESGLILLTPNSTPLWSGWPTLFSISRPPTSKGAGLPQGTFRVPRIDLFSLLRDLRNSKEVTRSEVTVFNVLLSLGTLALWTRSGTSLGSESKLPRWGHSRRLGPAVMVSSAREVFCGERLKGYTREHPFKAPCESSPRPGCAWPVRGCRAEQGPGCGPGGLGLAASSQVCP